MYAIEFRAQVKNGMIEIPQQYREKLRDVRVIVLAEEQSESNDMIAQLLASPRQVENFVPLSREEIYRREKGN
jgi:hypothetical protein